MVDTSLDVKRWTKSEIDYLRHHYHDTPLRTLAQRFGVSVGTLSAQVRRMKLPSKKLKWTPEKEEILRARHNSTSLKDLAEELNVSQSHLRRKILTLGLRAKGPRAKWTKERVLERIHHLHTTGKDLSASGIKRREPALYTHGCSLFGRWRSAILEAGIPYDAVRRDPGTQRWSKKRVTTEIRERAKRGLPLHVSAVKSSDQRLLNAANQHWGTWKAAVEGAGLDYAAIRRGKRDWTEAELINRIRNLATQGAPLQASVAKREHSSLYGVARLKLGSWKKAIQAAGLDYSTINLRAKEIRWTKKLIKEAIRELISSGADASEGVVIRSHSSLRTAARRRFGSWAQAVTSAGFNYDEIRRDMDTEAWRGRLFEDLAFEALVSIDRILARSPQLHLQGELCIPDFIDLESGTWIDAKLSSTGESTDRTIEKYEPRAPALEILYFRGPRRRSYSRVSFRHISTLYPELERRGKSNLISEFRSLGSRTPG